MTADADHGQGDTTLTASTRFPGRLTLYVAEAARVLSLSPQQIVELLQSGKMTGEDVARRGELPPNHATVPRSNWRVPVAVVDALIVGRKNQ